MLKFTVTIFGPDEHTERNAAQVLWSALEKGHETISSLSIAMLIGEAKYELDAPTRRH